MGINVNGLRFLLQARSAGVDFSRTAMIGRQGLHVTLEQFCHVIREEFGHDVDRKSLEAMYAENYCEELLRYLGADEVHSFDYSDYENSSHPNDFNQPIADKYHS